MAIGTQNCDSRAVTRNDHLLPVLFQITYCAEYANVFLLLLVYFTFFFKDVMILI